MAYYNFRRKARAAKKFVKKRVIKPYTDLKNQRGFKNRMRLYQEVTALKKMINAEKQNVESNVSTIHTLGQFSGAGSGRQCIDIMPTIAQGFGEDNRKGDSVKVCSLVLKLKVETNSFNTLQPTAYTFYLIRQPTNPVNITQTPALFLEPNPFSGVEDYYSNRNYEHFKDFQVIGKVTGMLKSNTNDSLNQIQVKSHTLARKCEFHIRYDKGTNTIINNPIYLLAVANDGDRGTANHIKFQYAFKVYYYDN